MNKLKLIFLFAITSSLLSCSSDDSSSSGINASIVGTWQASNISLDGTASTNVSGQNFSAPIISTVTNNNFVIIFEENPNNYSSTGSIDIDGSVSFLGTTYEQNIAGFNPVGSGTYTINGNKLILTGSSDLDTVVIEELTETRLRLNITNIIQSVQDGQNLTATLNSKITFIKQ